MIHSDQSRGPTRRALLAGTACLVASSALTGCEGRRPRLLMTLVDLSASVRGDDWSLYKKSYVKAVNSLRPAQEASACDRLVLAAITDTPLSRFAILGEGLIQHDGTPERRDQVEAARKALVDLFDGLAQTGVAPQQTRILESLVATREIMTADPTRVPELLVCSDMLEDSNQAQFELNPPAGEATQRLLERLRQDQLLPNFANAAVYVSGAGGKDAEVYSTVKTFWGDYFRAAQGSLAQYSRVPVEFAAAEAV